MSRQWLRKIALTVQSKDSLLDFMSMQVRFMVQRGDVQTPNTMEARIYNLSDETVRRLRNAPQGEFSRVVLQAGYESGNFGLIFSGNIKYTRIGRETAVDSYLDIVAADGDSAYNFAVVNKTLAAGSTPNDRIDAAAEAMGKVTPPVTKGEGTPAYDSKLPRGRPMYGLARDVLRDTARGLEATWSIDDGKVQFLPKNSYAAGDPTVLTSATGMIGFPEQTPSGIRIRSLLNPNLKVGSRVKVDNKSIQTYRWGLSLSAAVANAFVPKLDADGLYRVIVAEHSGDTRGNEWYTDLLCVGINADIAPSMLGKTAVAPDEIVVIPHE